MRDICHSCFNSGHKNALSLAWVSVLVERVITGRQKQEKPPEDSLGRIITCAWFSLLLGTWMVSAFDLGRPLEYTYLGIKMKIPFQDKLSKESIGYRLCEYNPTIWVTKGNNSRNLCVSSNLSGQRIQCTKLVCVFQGALGIKNLPANPGDIRALGAISWLGRSPGGGHGNPLQYTFLENSHGQRSLEGYSPESCRELDMTESTACTQFGLLAPKLFSRHFCQERHWLNPSTLARQGSSHLHPLS